MLPTVSSYKFFVSLPFIPALNRFVTHGGRENSASKFPFCGVAGNPYRPMPVLETC